MKIDVAGSIRSARVIEVLARLISNHGAPAYLRSDSGPEFVSHAVLKWLTDNRIDTAIIDPGKPWQNGTNESFNGKFRDVCLSVEWFRNRTEARIIIEAWRRHYNPVRPHMSLYYCRLMNSSRNIRLQSITPTEPSSRNKWLEIVMAGHFGDLSYRL